MTNSTAGMSRPLEATSVATRIRAASARKRPREEIRSDCGREECSAVTRCSRSFRMWVRRFAVSVRFVKMIVDFAEFRGVERRVCRYASRVWELRRRYFCFSVGGMAILSRGISSIRRVGGKGEVLVGVDFTHKHLSPSLLPLHLL